MKWKDFLNDINAIAGLVCKQFKFIRVDWKCLIENSSESMDWSNRYVVRKHLLIKDKIKYRKEMISIFIYVWAYDLKQVQLMTWTVKYPVQRCQIENGKKVNWDQNARSFAYDSNSWDMKIHY